MVLYQGGSYAHVVLEEHKPASSLTTITDKKTKRIFTMTKSRRQQNQDNNSSSSDEENDCCYYILPMSASSTAHLSLYCERMANYLLDHSSSNGSPSSSSSSSSSSNSLLLDVCGTMACHRSEFVARKCFVATTCDDMAKQLADFAKGGSSPPQPFLRGSKARVAFVFTGQGMGNLDCV